LGAVIASLNIGKLLKLKASYHNPFSIDCLCLCDFYLSKEKIQIFSGFLLIEIFKI